MNIPLRHTFKFRVLLLGVVAGLIPLAIIFLTVGWLSQDLKRDFLRSLEDIKAQEGQRFQEQQQTLVQSQLRQKALDVAHEVAHYLKYHPEPWEALRRDPELRQIAVQPVGVLGETFLVELREGKILFHSQPLWEGRELAQVFPTCRLEEILAEVKRKGAARMLICDHEIDSDPAQPCPHQVFLAPVSGRAPNGPPLLVVARPEAVKLVNATAPGRTIFKTALNLSRTLIDTRLDRFQGQLVLIFACLGVLGLLIGLALCRRLHREMAALTQAAEAYNAGDLDYRLSPVGRDELGQLARTLNHMAAGLKENTVSRAEWENTFNIIPDQIMVLDQDQRVVRLNRAAASYLGISPEEALGRPCYELMHQVAAPSAGCAFQRALREGHQTWIEFPSADKRATFLVTVDPLRDQEGRIIGGVHVARDITPLKQAQQELARTSHFLNQIIATAPLALGVVNREGLFTHINPQVEVEYGFAPADLLDKPYSVMYADAEEMGRVLAELRKEGEVLRRQVLLRHKNGQAVPSRLSIRKLYGDDGEVLGSVSLSRNISGEINLQRQLEQAQKLEAVGTLAGGLAHNFNNLLMVIMGLAGLMRAKLQPGHPFGEDLEEIQRQVRAGVELTKKLLTFARGGRFEIQPVALNDLVRATADMFARTRRDIPVHLALAPNLPPVAADPSLIQQVLMNLLINAWQAMPTGGAITLRTQAGEVAASQDPAWELQPGPVVTLTVQDTGVGMDLETLGRLFEPFFTTKAPDQGTGLGLASAYRIIKGHGGAIQVKSEKGQGSTFTVLLPVSLAQPLILPVEEARILPGQGTILVVEDEPVLRQVAGRLLERLGYRVLLAPGGEQALEIFQAQGATIDLVLLDLIMPGWNGFQTLERLRALDPQVRVLLCSGYGDRTGKKLPPGVDFLAKPYSLEILSQKLAATLKRNEI